MTIKLLRHHVLVQLSDVTEANETAKRMKELGLDISGLDKREKEAVELGTIKQIGPLAFTDNFDEPPVKVGDKVSLLRYAGKAIQDVDGTKYHVFSDEDILAIIV